MMAMKRSLCCESYHLSSFSFIIVLISPFLLLLTGQRNEKIRLHLMCHCTVTPFAQQKSIFLTWFVYTILFPVSFFLWLLMKTQLKHDEFWWSRSTTKHIHTIGWIVNILIGCIFWVTLPLIWSSDHVEYFWYLGYLGRATNPANIPNVKDANEFWVLRTWALSHFFASRWRRYWFHCSDRAQPSALMVLHTVFSPCWRILRIENFHHTQRSQLLTRLCRDLMENARSVRESVRKTSGYEH